jgi:hypothetical protein
VAKPSLAWRLKRPAKLLLVATGIPILAGIGWKLFEGGNTRVDVASALFICGGIIVVGAAATGGGAGGQRMSAYSGGGAPNDMPFGAVLIAALVIVLGVGVLKI